MESPIRQATLLAQESFSIDKKCSSRKLISSHVLSKFTKQSKLAWKSRARIYGIALHVLCMWNQAWVNFKCEILYQAEWTEFWSSLWERAQISPSSHCRTTQVNIHAMQTLRLQIPQPYRLQESLGAILVSQSSPELCKNQPCIKAVRIRS